MIWVRFRIRVRTRLKVVARAVAWPLGVPHL